MDNFTNALFDSVKNGELAATTREVGEVLFDSFLEEGLLKSLPVISILYGVGKTAVGIRDQLFISKVRRFLLSLADIPQEEREKFVDGLCNEHKRVAGSAVMGALETIEAPEKADIIGNLFRAYVEEKICLDTFRRLVFKVCNLSLPDLLAIRDICKGTRHTDALIYADLENAGLLRLAVIDANGDKPAHDCYETTRHAELLVEHGLLSCRL